MNNESPHVRHSPVLSRFFWIAFFVASHLVFSQTTDVRGVVSDSVTGQRLVYANILLKGTARGATTNSQGFFLLPNVPFGTHEIIISYLGYVQERRTIVVHSNEALFLGIRLKPTAIEAETIEVIGGMRNPLLETSTSVHVVEPAQIRLVPVAVQEDLFRSLLILPGMVSTSDVTSQFYVRGGAGDQNLILLDGMRVYNPYHAFGIFSLFDPEIIKSTEVHLGAFPPGYGGRLSSVVNLISREGRADRISGRANANFLAMNLRLEGNAEIVEDMTWLASVRKSISARPLRNFLGKNVPIEFYDSFVKVGWPAWETGKVGVTAFFSGDDVLDPNPEDPNYHWRNSSVGIFAGGLISRRTFVEAVGYSGIYRMERDPKRSRVISPALTSVKELGIRSSATFYGDDGDLYLLGFETIFPTIRYDFVNRHGIHLRVEELRPEMAGWFRILAKRDRWQFDGGVHADFFALFNYGGGFSVAQPRLNVSYRFLETWTAKASYGRFSQTLIALNNEDDVISVFQGWTRIPENAGFQSSSHYVIGFEGYLTPGLSLNLQSYYKDYPRLTIYNRDQIDILDPQFINVRGEAYGFESLLRYGHSLIDVYTAYTLAWTFVKTSGLTYFPRYDRRHTLNALFVVHVLKGLDIGARWEFGSGFPFTQTIGYYDRLRMQNIFRNPMDDETGQPYTMLGPKNAARLPSYHRLDASITYTFEIGFLRGVLGAYFVNLSSRKNLFYFDRRTGQEISMLPFTPSATLTLEY